MLFHFDMGLDLEAVKSRKIIHRDAARAVIFHDNLLLLIHSNKGDYKFPGGGVKAGESMEQALRREVKEEAGYFIDTVGEMIGEVNQRKKDYADKYSIFEMKSVYYICSITGEQSAQQLDDYEADLEFVPEWISIPEAVKKNEMILKNNKADRNSWVERETKVLKEILNAKFD